MSEPPRPWTFRPARAGDAAALAALAERTFRDAFGAMNTAADMDLHCTSTYSPAIQGGEIQDSAFINIVAEQGGELIAYAQLHRGAPPRCVGGRAPIELCRFYVLAQWHGTGLAQELMAAVGRQALAAGADTIWLGVWERNPRAIQFYRRRGFQEVGEQLFVLGSDPQRDLVMTWSPGSMESNPGSRIEREAKPESGARPFRFNDLRDRG